MAHLLLQVQRAKISCRHHRIISTKEDIPKKSNYANDIYTPIELVYELHENLWKNEYRDLDKKFSKGHRKSTIKDKMIYKEPIMAENSITENRMVEQSENDEPKSIKKINMYKSIKIGKSIYMKYYVPPPPTFRCEKKSELCKPCALITYHLDDCNFTQLQNYSQCSCGGIQKDLCQCTWTNYANGAIKKIGHEQILLFERLLKNTNPRPNKRHERKIFTNFAKRFIDISFKHRPKEIDINVWEDYALPNNITEFRKINWETFMLMGFEISKNANNDSIRFQENINMYHGADQKYLKKIRKDPSKMNNDDRDLERLMKEELVIIAFPNPCIRMHTNLCINRDIKNVRIEH